MKGGVHFKVPGFAKNRENQGKRGMGNLSRNRNESNEGLHHSDHGFLHSSIDGQEYFGMTDRMPMHLQKPPGPLQSGSIPAVRVLCCTTQLRG